MELQILLVTLCVTVPMTMGQSNFASLLGNLGFGGGSSMSGSGSCPYQPHPNKFKFTQLVNNRIMTQDCAPGTMFDISKCSCVSSSSHGTGPMPGSNPRRDPPFGGGPPSENALMGLLQKMSGGGMPSSSSRPAPPAPFRPVSRSTRMKPGRVTDFTGPSGGLSVDLSNIKSPNQESGAIKYSPDSGMSLKPVVDPSMLPDVIPKEVLKMLNIPPKASDTSSQPLQTTPPTTTKAPTLKPSGSDLRAKVLSMLNKEKQPPKDKSNASALPLPPSVLKALNMAAPPPMTPRSSKSSSSSNKKNVLAPDLMNMLQKSMKSPFPITPSPTAPSSSRFHYTPVTKPPSPTMPRISSRQPDWFAPTRPPKTTAPRPSSNVRSRYMSTTRPGSRHGSPDPTPFPDPMSSFNFGSGGSGNPFGGSGNNNNNNNNGGSGNPMEALMSMLAGGMGGSMGGGMAALMGGLDMGQGMGGSGGGNGGQDPFADLMARMNPSTRPPTSGPPGGGAGGMDMIAAILGAAGDPSASGGFGPGSSMDSLLRQIGGPSGGGVMGGAMGGSMGGSMGGPMGGGNPFGGSSSGGGLGAAAAGMLAAGGAAAPPVPDMTNFFNAQGRMGVGLHSVGNINMFKLQELDRQGVIDISDLTPQGLAAANAHFAG